MLGSPLSHSSRISFPASLLLGLLLLAGGLKLQGPRARGLGFRVGFRIRRLVSAGRVRCCLREVLAEGFKTTCTGTTS